MELQVPIAQAYPHPPAVAAAGKVPGAALLPCTPSDPTVPRDGTAYALKFGLAQGFAVTVKRLHISLPVFVEENEALKEHTALTLDTTMFETEAEALEAYRSKGGTPWLTEEPNRGTYYKRSEHIKRTPRAVKIPSGKELEILTTVETKVSILPVEMTVVVRILGPDGPIYANTSIAQVNPIAGEQEAGTAIGIGVLEIYDDLTNPIELDVERVYGLELLLSLAMEPTQAANAQLGTEYNEATKTSAPGTRGVISLFYDVKATAVGK